MLKVHIKKSGHAQATRDWRAHPSENEGLIQRRAQYRVLGRDESGGYSELELSDQSDPGYIRSAVHERGVHGQERHR